MDGDLQNLLNDVAEWLERPVDQHEREYLEAVYACSIYADAAEMPQALTDRYNQAWAAFHENTEDGDVITINQCVGEFYGD